jgi:hypothetical protein
MTKLHDVKNLEPIRGSHGVGGEGRGSTRIRFLDVVRA